MSDKVTFDFESGEIIFDTPGQKGTEVDLHLREKRAAILAAAGYAQTDMRDVRKEVNAMFREFGFKGIVCAGSDDEDIKAAGLNTDQGHHS